MAVASWWTAALPVGRDTAPAGFVLFYAGLSAVLLSWLLLGRATLAGTDTVAALTRYTLAVAVPLLAAAPFGRDLWAYAAQGNLVRHGINPYEPGPSARAGVFTDLVSPRWLDSSSPYGPIWLRLSHLGVDLSFGHPTVAALSLRLPAFVGLLLWIWALPRLSARLNGDLAKGLWLGLASPLTLVLGVGGGHNDLLMIGLLLAGCALATEIGERGLVLGATLAALAMLIKSPAAIGIVFTVPLWLHANRVEIRPRPVLRACLIAFVPAAIVVAVVSLLSGLGYGWTGQVSADSQWISWLSLPSALVLFGRFVGGLSPLKQLDGVLRGFRTAGSVFTIVAVVALWCLALARNGRARTQLACLAGALGVAAVLAPSVQPWYYCWGLALAGLVVTRGVWLWLLIAVDLAFPLMIMPSGSGMESDWRAFPVIAAALVAAAVLVRTTEPRAPQ